jgi:predicted nucleotidyltransferase
MEKVSDDINTIVNEFSKEYIQDPNTMAVLLVGSYANAIPNENSDLDIYVIQETGGMRERGNTWKWRVEIEYFINPIKQVYEYLKNDPLIRPITAHMLSTSIIIYVNEVFRKEFDILMSEARKIMSAPIPSLSQTEIELFKYTIDDIIKDLKDLKETNNEFSYNLVAMGLTENCVNYLFRLHEEKIVKSKLMKYKIQEIDSVFFNLLNKVFENNYDLTTVIELSSYCENLLGGPREKEWKLRSPCTFE